MADARSSPTPIALPSIWQSLSWLLELLVNMCPGIRLLSVEPVARARISLLHHLRQHRFNIRPVWLDALPPSDSVWALPQLQGDLRLVMGTGHCGRSQMRRWHCFWSTLDLCRDGTSRTYRWSGARYTARFDFFRGEIPGKWTLVPRRRWCPRVRGLISPFVSDVQQGARFLKDRFTLSS